MNEREPFGARARLIFRVVEAVRMQRALFGEVAVDLDAEVRRQVECSGFIREIYWEDASEQARNRLRRELARLVADGEKPEFEQAGDRGLQGGDPFGDNAAVGGGNCWIF